jgi:hypothetical protein
MCRNEPMTSSWVTSLAYHRPTWISARFTACWVLQWLNERKKKTYKEVTLAYFIMCSFGGSYENRSKPILWQIRWFDPKSSFKLARRLPARSLTTDVSPAITFCATMLGLGVLCLSEGMLTVRALFTVRRHYTLISVRFMKRLHWVTWQSDGLQAAYRNCTQPYCSCQNTQHTPGRKSEGKTQPERPRSRYNIKIDIKYDGRV